MTENIPESQDKDQDTLEKYQIHFELFKSLSKTNKKILMYLFNIFEAAYIKGNDLEIKVGLESKKGICSKVGCSKKTGSRFIETFKTFFIGLKDYGTAPLKIDSFYGEATRYRMSPSFFKALVILRIGGCFDGKSYEQQFFTEVSHNKESISKLLTVKIKNVQIGISKCPHLYNLITNLLEEISVLPKEHLFEQKIRKDIKNKNIICFNWNLLRIRTKDKEFIMRNFTVDEISRAIEDTLWYKGKGHIIKIDLAYLLSRLNSHSVGRKNAA